jgi:phosphopantothenoylcysteine decarboxylase/phosphopantothenate--cysteine ligase
MAAAVADYRAASVSKGKIASGNSSMVLKLAPTTDILAAIAAGRAGLKTIGFALETERGRERARQKLRKKGCDLIVLNDPTRPGSAFGGETNEVVFLYADGREEALPIMKKEDVARELMRRIEQLETPGARRGRSTR